VQRRRRERAAQQAGVMHDAVTRASQRAVADDRRQARRAFVAFAITMAVLAAMLLAARLLAAPLASPGLGFAAKVVCSSVFVSGMTPARARADLPDEPLARLIRTRVDTANARVVATVPLVARREARHRTGLGCTLEPADGSPVALPPALPGEAPSPQAEPWPVDAASAAAELDDAGAERLRAALDNAFAEPAGSRPRRTRAIVVVHRGRLIAERYADGYTADTRFAGWSMAKSVTNALVGILVGERRISLADRLDRPEWQAPADPRRAITVHDLLQMSSGLEFDESYTPTGGATRMLFDTRDVAAFAAASPLAHEPGSAWYYSSGTTNLLSWHVRQAFAGDDVAYLSFPRRALFDRIGMHGAVFEPDAAGTFVGSSFVYATARGWARFGLLFLQEGVWNGERILPAGWVAYSLTPAPAPLGRYGAHWWLNAGEPLDITRRPWPDLSTDLYWAAGFQGQHVAIVPSRELVVVRLGASADERAWSLGDFLAELLAALPGR
jgi:CubicO group peptidase (beta-lactamase class C family)